MSNGLPSSVKRLAYEEADLLNPQPQPQPHGVASVYADKHVVNKPWSKMKKMKNRN